MATILLVMQREAIKVGRIYIEEPPREGKTFPESSLVIMYVDSVPGRVSLLFTIHEVEGGGDESKLIVICT